MTDSAVMSTDAPQVPLRRRCPFELPPEYGKLRAQGPLSVVTLDGGRRAWLVTGHDEARMLLADPRISTDVTDPRYPEFIRIPDHLKAGPEAVKDSQTFVQMDRPDHATHRRMAIPHFIVRRAAALRPMLEKAAGELIDRMLAAGPPVDLVKMYAVPLPALVLAELFGVPVADREFFHECLTGVRVVGQLGGYFARFLAEGEADGLLGAVAERFRAGELTAAKAVATLMMLIVAGSETSENMIALGTLMLLENPAQLDRLRADPDALPAAVEEMLRYGSIADVLLRLATADIDIAGRTIRSGDAVVVSLAAANRDGDAFAEPDVFDFSQPGRRQLAFGHGPHQCLGNNVARIELRVALSVLFDRIPTLRLAVPYGQLPLKPASGLQGVAELPVSWTDR
jgi:pentalenic acid synthase